MHRKRNYFRLNYEFKKRVLLSESCSICSNPPNCYSVYRHAIAYFVVIIQEKFGVIYFNKIWGGLFSLRSTNMHVLIKIQWETLYMYMRRSFARDTKSARAIATVTSSKRRTKVWLLHSPFYQCWVTNCLLNNFTKYVHFTPKPRSTLVFSGWQFPMLPSRAVSIYIIFILWSFYIQCRI